MEKKIDINIKEPKDFKDIRALMQEYEINKEYIELAQNGKQPLLGFIWEREGTCCQYKTLDYKFGLIFANILEKRNKEIEKFLTKNI